MIEREGEIKMMRERERERERDGGERERCAAGLPDCCNNVTACPWLAL